MTDDRLPTGAEITAAADERRARDLGLPPTSPHAPLMPCPFCGKPPRSEWNGVTVGFPDDGGYWAIECCSVHVHEDDESDATRVWNTRPTPAPVAGGREALEQISSFNITPDTGYSVAQAMRRTADDALAALPVALPLPGMKLAYIKRWRTIVQLPETYAAEIVEALAAPHQHISDETASAPIDITGWKLVPDQPTEAMWQAGRSADIHPGDSYSKVWSAMFEAAPNVDDCETTSTLSRPDHSTP